MNNTLDPFLHRPDPEGFHPLGKGRPAPPRMKVKHIYIMRDQLLYDIDTESLMVARARRQDNIDPNNIPADEDGFRPMFKRWVDTYLSKALSRMKAYVKEPPRIAKTNSLKEWTEKDILLEMPDNWNENAFDPLATAVHDYIVNGVLFEYFSLNLTGKDPVTVSKHEAMTIAYDDIKNNLISPIPGTAQKPLHHFGIL